MTSAALTLTQALTCLSPMIVAGVVMIIWEWWTIRSTKGFYA